MGPRWWGWSVNSLPNKGEPGSIPSRDAPGCSHVGIVPHDASQQARIKFASLHRSSFISRPRRKLCLVTDKQSLKPSTRLPLANKASASLDKRGEDRLLPRHHPPWLQRARRHRLLRSSVPVPPAGRFRLPAVATTGLFALKFRNKELETLFWQCLPLAPHSRLPLPTCRVWREGCSTLHSRGSLERACSAGVSTYSTTPPFPLTPRNSCLTCTCLGGRLWSLPLVVGGGGGGFMSPQLITCGGRGAVTSPAIRAVDGKRNCTPSRWFAHRDNEINASPAVRCQQFIIHAYENRQGACGVYLHKHRLLAVARVGDREIVRAIETEVSMEVASKLPGGGAISPRRPADQRHRPAWFPRAKNQDRPRRESNPVRLGGSEHSNLCVTAALTNGASRHCCGSTQFKCFEIRIVLNVRDSSTCVSNHGCSRALLLAYSCPSPTALTGQLTRSALKRRLSVPTPTTSQARSRNSWRAKGQGSAEDNGGARTGQKKLGQETNVLVMGVTARPLGKSVGDPPCGASALCDSVPCPLRFFHLATAEKLVSVLPKHTGTRIEIRTRTKTFISSDLAARGYLNEMLPQRWIGRGAAGDQALHHWPPKKPDQVFRPPLPPNIDDLKTRITDAIQTVTPDMLTSVERVLSIA
ncbi:hypothetical protein PR048_032714 [Dryococelus australis]|uniref:Uncharacterized protein n=1 Tax=Dryococelus australis TaxID=614101 RepID=A0ABQ9G3R6_9NEOP|nr:hypothetical protein PR048_032714 [Dryococelus australis]